MVPRPTPYPLPAGPVGSRPRGLALHALHAVPAVLAVLAMLVTLIGAATSPARATGTLAGSPSTAAAVGADPLGSGDDVVPPGALVVAPTGSDAATGTLASPLRTIARAMSLARTGQTILLRGGSYHERVVVTKQLTFQGYPGEAVWLDGSVPVDGWVADGPLWRRDGWTVRHDASPTYTRGAAENPSAGWTFVNYASYPMAAHPDQVFVDGAALRQVASRAQVTPGAFFLDESTSQLFVGTDPTGRDVRASDLGWAMNIRAAGVVVRGIGVRRYAPSVWMLGAVVVERPARIENVLIEDSATTGLSVVSAGVSISRVTVRRSGMLGIHAHVADDISITGTLSEQNNLERFNTAPVSGGAKITTSRGVTVRDSVFRDNIGPGLWLDESAYAATLVGNRLVGNSGHGISFEISARAVIAGNLFLDNGGHGLKVNNSSDVAVWNNTFVGGGRPVNLVQDTRRNDDPSDSAIDDRVPWPDPDMPWLLRDVVVANNVVSRPTTRANCLLCVEDYSGQQSAEQMGIRADGNVYERRSVSAPSWTTVWSRGPGNPSVFTSVRAFTASTGQDARSLEVAGAADATTGALTAELGARASSVALPLTDAVASASGRPSGLQVVGAFDLSGQDVPTLTPLPVPVTSPAPITLGIPPAVVPVPPTSTGTTTSQPAGPASADHGSAATSVDRTTLLRDSFERAVRRGWGRTESGRRWIASGSVRRPRVADGVAVMEGASRGTVAMMSLAGLSVSDADVGVAVDLGRSGRAGIAVRQHRRNGYLLSVEWVGRGRLVLRLERTTARRSVGLGRVRLPAVRGPLHLRLAVSGAGEATLRGKVWGAGPEPSGWNATAVDTSSKVPTAGTVGLALETGAARARASFRDLVVGDVG